MFCGFLSHFFIVVNHPLVTPIHKVDFDAFYSPIFKSSKKLEVILYCQPCQPKYNAYIFLFAITDKFMQVYVRVGSIRIFCRFCPAFVHDDIGHSVTGGKVDEVLVGVQITSGYKVYVRTVRSGTIPPFPTG